MNFRQQNAGPRSPLLWSARLAAGFCVLLMIVSTCQQAAHDHLVRHAAHGPQASSSIDGLPGSSDDAGCPLCIAMHGAAPSSVAIRLVHAVTREVVAMVPVDRQPETRWHFVQFSRPPPSLVNA